MLKKSAIQTIEQTIGYEFTDKQLISQAFTRSSYHYEHPEEQDNENLEFIGDSVLSLIIVNILIDKFSARDGSGLYSCLDEGDFTKLKNALVNKTFLAKQMSELCLHEYLRMSIGDEIQEVICEKSVLEDLFESIIGAVYLDSNRNLKKTESVVTNMIDIEKFFKSYNGKTHISYKNDVQEWCQKQQYKLPIYKTQQNNNGFISYCEIPEVGVSKRGEGRNRKEAENNAAEAAYEELITYVDPIIDNVIVSFENAVNMLREYCRLNGYESPQYKIEEEIHSDNNHTFIVSCSFEKHYIYDKGKTFKEAKMNAAFAMLSALGVV